MIILSNLCSEYFKSSPDYIITECLLCHRGMWISEHKRIIKELCEKNKITLFLYCYECFKEKMKKMLEKDNFRECELLEN